MEDVKIFDMLFQKRTTMYDFKSQIVPPKS